MGEISTQEKYKIINKLISKDNNELNISWLCDVACVSRSGFYKWKNNQDILTNKELQDRADFELILEAYNFRGYKKGSRSILMRLLHKGIKMNRKKIQRLMRKYNLFCPIRKANPYRRMARALKEATVAPNIVERKFREYGARKILLTDITYIIYGKCKKSYVSTIKDAYTKEILGHVTSESLEEDFVLITVNLLVKNHGKELSSDTIFHSDQGVHYKAFSLQKLLKDNDLRQSMSRKANCWDNAPKESFYGHMKDEIKDRIKKCTKHEEVVAIIDDYMDYYNNDRYQWELSKLTPKQYYQYVLTGEHPLGLSESKK